jgi:hypothetical protein
MRVGNILTPYYAGMTSILKFFALYILSKWYGISFGYPFIFLFFKIYQIIMNKRYSLSSFSIIDQFLIIKSLLFGKIYIKKINLNLYNNKKREDIIQKLKEFIKENSSFKRIIYYKWNNYYWRNLEEKEIDIVIIDKIDNLDSKLNKKFNFLREPSYKFFLLENGSEVFRIIFKYNSLMNDYHIDLLIKFLNGNDIKNTKKKKINKILKIFFEFITYPIQIFFEILIIIFLSNKAI